MVFASNEFKSIEMTNPSGAISVSLRSRLNANFLDSLLNNDSNLRVSGYMTDPIIKPIWIIPGMNFTGNIDGYDCNFKFLATIQNRVVGIEQITGSRMQFEITIVSKFNDNA